MFLESRTPEQTCCPSLQFREKRSVEVSLPGDLKVTEDNWKRTSRGLWGQLGEGEEALVDDSGDLEGPQDYLWVVGA